MHVCGVACWYTAIQYIQQRGPISSLSLMHYITLQVDPMQMQHHSTVHRLHVAPLLRNVKLA